MAATDAGADPPTASTTDDLFGLLVDTARTLAARYPEDTGAFVRLAKLTEETGEVAAQINIWAGTGLKRSKHGPFDARKLAAELSDALRAAVSIAVDFDILNLLITEIRGRHNEILRPGRPTPIQPAARDPASRP
jgi:NTP pyrophosphatase (non-canonical NTP hydrolase)